MDDFIQEESSNGNGSIVPGRSPEKLELGVQSAHNRRKSKDSRARKAQVTGRTGYHGRVDSAARRHVRDTHARELDRLEQYAETPEEPVVVLDGGIGIGSPESYQGDPAILETGMQLTPEQGLTINTLLKLRDEYGVTAQEARDITRIAPLAELADFLEDHPHADMHGFAQYISDIETASPAVWTAFANASDNYASGDTRDLTARINAEMDVIREASALLDTPYSARRRTQDARDIFKDEVNRVGYMMHGLEEIADPRRETTVSVKGRPLSPGDDFAYHMLEARVHPGENDPFHNSHQDEHAASRADRA